MVNTNDLKKRMEGSLSSLHHEFGSLRTGRASASLVENIMVEAYGNAVPLNQVASVNVPEPRLITLNVWDRSLASAVEKAIFNANLGLNPASEGQLIRIPIPPLTEERRKEMVKVASKFAEQQRVAIRNIRRDGMEEAKKAEKDGSLSKDDAKRRSDEIQKLTDDFIKKIDEALAAKEKDIMAV